jgi:hypothetical protein
MKIKDSNLRTAAVAAGLCLVLILTIALLSGKPSSDTLLKRPSTFFTDASGSRAVYLVLEKVLPSAGQWRLPITELKQPSPQGVGTLIAMGPGMFGQGEVAALDAWVESGGQLILAADTDWLIQKNNADRTTKNFLARHGITPAPPPRRPNSRSTGGIDAAVTRKAGRGRIIYVPNSYAFSNEALRTTDNAVWLVDRCLEWGGGAVFDEYHLGFGSQRSFSSLIASFAVTPWGLVCLQLALAGIVYLFACKRRFGRPLEELPVERTNPIETVQAVAGLFESARARALSARAIHQYLNSHVSSIMGYRIDLMAPESRDRLAGPMRIERADLDSYAQAASAAMTGRTMTDAELIRFGQQATAIARSFSHGTVRSKFSAAAG